MLNTIIPFVVAAIVLGQDSVPLYKNLGNYHHAIRTTVPAAQAYFDQGLRLAYGFNHEEAVRSFQEAARRDPKCAICWWGAAYAYGPNINLPMDSAANANATAALVEARRLRAYASPRERAYIEALRERHGSKAAPSGDSAYARRMERLAKQYAADADAAVLAAEAKMLLRPWNYWTAEGAAQPGTQQIVSTLEKVIRANPRHPGACHYYIHAMEAADAAKALPCAERLASLMPGAGHMVHMPGHIYIRLGRWNDAIESNIHAIHADDTYLQDAKPTAFYPLAYYPHNHAFLAFAAMMSGRGQLALDYARSDAAAIPIHAAAAFPILQQDVVKPMLMLTAFGKWTAVLSEKDPPRELRVARGLSAYAKGLAHAALGHDDVAKQMLDSLRLIAGEVKPDAGAPDIALDIAHHALMGEIALRATRLGEAEQHFRTALRLQKGMTYNEPPDWYYPIEHSLGMVLLQQNKPGEAEALYRQDLKLYPDNIWSLTGLRQALQLQKRSTAAIDAKLINLRVKIDRDQGRIIDHKKSDGPYKDVPIARKSPKK